LSEGARDPVLEMGELLEPRTWCRQSWCRADVAKTAEHFDGDGCTCHGPAENEPAAELIGPEPAAEPVPPAPARPTAYDQRLTILTAKASRLTAFACRACGAQTRRMIEAPAMFFRCEQCAAADRWPPSRRQA
jgi:hypothetical protein